MKSSIFLLSFALLLSCGTLIAQPTISTKVPGTVVTHVPASSGKYIGSPSICILPNGDYLVSHDLFGPQSNEFVSPDSRIFRSKDKGKTWEQIAEIHGQFWSKLFVHRGRLFFLGTSKHHGNVIIRESKDEGVTWTEPVDGQNGLLLVGEYHCAPMPLIEHNGRLWRAMEDAMGEIKQWGKRYGTFMLSMPLDADPMKADSWTSSNVLRYDGTMLDGNFGAWIEGNAVVDPTGQVVNILRVDRKTTLDEKAAYVRISADGKTASFDREKDFIDFPGGAKKFTIRYDPKSKLYWTLTNYIPDSIKQTRTEKNPSRVRNVLALCSSKDLRNWEVKKVVLQHPDIVKHGFQYVDWLFRGKDILLVSRTAYDDEFGGAHNNHDANFVTYHEVRKFRRL